MGKKSRRDVVSYLVKWKGFDSKFNTWERSKHLINEGCQEAIDEFEEAHSVIVNVISSL